PSNLVEIQIAGPVGASPPTITSLGSAAALAGNPWQIDGSGFSPVPAENEVRISNLLADVVTAATTQLQVVVPFGAASGSVTVRTPQGEGLSSTFLPIRTSISGIVEDTLRQPIPGVPIRLADGSITATTNEEGTFVLADVPPGVQTVEVEGEALTASPPYPSVTLKVSALANRDNQFPRSISIQQATGASAVIGEGSGGVSPPLGGGADLFSLAQEVEPPPVRIETDGFLLEVPANSRVRFPRGATSGPVFLTPIEGARAPVNLPTGFFSSSIVQITPFGVTIDPGARLVFPNSAGLPAGSEAFLFRYDPASGRFLRESTRPVVSADGQSIETPPGSIRVTSLYFVAIEQPTTTVTGRVLEKGSLAPVRNAVVSLRGQEGRTDGNGSYLLRAVPVKEKEEIAVEVQVQRASSRTDRVTSATAPAVVGGLTRLPDVILPDRNENRPPSILGPTQSRIFAGRETLIRYSVHDPDKDEIEMVSSEGPTWATIAPAEKGSIGTYDHRLAPTAKDVGRFVVELTAVDRRGGKQTVQIKVEVKETPGPPPAPVAADLTVTTPEDTEVEISLLPKEPPSVPQAYQIVTGPFNGKLDGADGRYRYLPSQDFFGTDRFTYRVIENGQQSRLATVTVTITPVNDPPALVLPSNQTVTAGRLIRLPISATDPDSDQTLTLAPILPLPTGATFQRTRPDAGTLVWTPTANQLGIFTIRFSVTDSHTPPARTEGSFQLRVVQ
ncbi:MAG: Ig-like domain-containing protein, partial [Blastocatellia bacterium]